LGEACDGQDFGNETCATQGFEGGTLICKSNCTVDTILCFACGDGKVNTPDEACEPNDLQGETCISRGYEWGTLSCDATTCDFDESECASGYRQGFENPSLPSEFVLSGDADWFVQSTEASEGARAIQAGDIGDDETSEISLTVDFSAAGEVSFRYRTSSESLDYLRFYVDGLMVAEKAGPGFGFILEEHSVGAGTHELKWAYEKDYAIDAEDDTVWIDDLQITNGTIP